jgi:CelD/BcsL family acetyltransferase involved in cellulose biosynthesis/ribosomal protein S18 acetylase RimI-like enzyme
MICEIVRDDQAFAALESGWDALVDESRSGLFLRHRWLRAWWRAYRGIDELWVLVLRQDQKLLAAWPLHLRTPRSGTLKVAELRLLGDLGAAQRSLVCPPPDREVATERFVQLLAHARGWDVLEAPVVSARVADLVDVAAQKHGLKADRHEWNERRYVDLPPAGSWDEFAEKRKPARVVGEGGEASAEGAHEALDGLLRLLRKEWAAREAASPVADPQAVQFLHDVAPAMVAEGTLRIGQLRVGGSVVAADLVARDRDRHVQLLCGVDPEYARQGASAELLFASMRAAVEHGARRFELADPVDGDEEPPVRTATAKVLRVRLWSNTTTARLHRGMASVKDAVQMTDALGVVDRLQKAAPVAVQRAVARVATYATLHLYRGELFTRDVRETGEVSIGLFSLADFEALDEAERDAFIQRLDLSESYCRQKWSRGDMVVVARVAGQPSGIVWCARTSVFVPDIAREVKPGPGECYIHDVFVHPDERGRQLAPAMLDFLSRELRARDVYRAWALIERSNTASTRAFEKAAYASIADVVYARMSLVSRLIVRPPDPEARAFLGAP